jgi:hypothetical protein
MQLQTTRHGPARSTKPFAWSYSKLKNFEACPKRHYHVDIAKDFKEADSEALLWGNRVHKGLAIALETGRLGSDLKEYKPWLDRI